MIDFVLAELEGIRGKRVALQLPEGLKHVAHEVVSFLEERGNEVFLFIDPVYGACDVRDEEAKKLGAELLIHVGHTPFVKETVIPVKYVEVHLPVDVDAVTKALERIRGKIALCTTVQYVHALEEIKRRVPNVVFGMGKLTKYPGQILGCDASACAVEADVNVFLGDGLFHAIAMYMTKERPTYVVAPTGELKEVTEECRRFLRVREGLKAKALDAERWGVVVSTKKGQMNVEAAKNIKKALEDVGKKAHILVCDYFYPEYVLGMEYDVYVFTGCPRVALDDWKAFKKPVLTPGEALEVVEWLKEERLL